MKGERVVENSFSSFNRSAPPNFCNSVSKRIFSDIAGDITIVVEGQSFILHKFPLVSRSGKIRKLVADTRDTDMSRLEFLNLPGGPGVFELAAKFCYTTNFEITTANIAPLRCAAEYLEMTDDYAEENLVTRTEIYLNEIVMQSVEKSIAVLRTCESLVPFAEEVNIPNRCIEAIARNACREQLTSGLSHLDCKGGSRETVNNQDWWTEDLATLRIDHFKRVVTAMRNAGVHRDSITSCLIHYAQVTFKGIGRTQSLDPSRVKQMEEKVTVEILVSLLPEEKDALIPLNFLFGMLRMAVMVDSTLACRLDLEKKIGFQLEMASLDDLLIPSLQGEDSLFDVDTVHRILVNFLQRIEEEPEEGHSGYESEEVSYPSHDSILKVGRLIEGYLAEIAPDPYLKLQKFMAIIELLPDYARIVDDGIYRAIDTYLKAHPGMTENECRRLSKLIDCQKLSQEACDHAAQNERLPVQMTIQVLYFEQLRLKNALVGTFADGFLSQRMSSGVPSAAVSPRDNYASLRRENRDLKLELSRMRMRLNDLEKEQICLKQGMEKSAANKTILTSISKRFGKISLFGQPTTVQRQKSSRKSHRAERSNVRRN